MMRRTAVRCGRLLGDVLFEVAENSGCRWMSGATSSPQWVFLGPPGVGKGTYSKRIAQHIRVPHISTGDLVREEISRQTPQGNRMQEMISGGHLLPNEMILNLLNARLDKEKNGFVLDGFPRTRPQAEKLSELTDIHLVVNLDLREEVLVEKCVGRRVCEKCGGNYNLANIYLKGEEGKSEIVMPPLPPPPQCLKYMRMRDDDKEDVIRKRLQVYRAEAKLVEDFYRDLGVLLDFEITSGIPETMPVLLQALDKYLPSDSSEEGKKMAA